MFQIFANSNKTKKPRFELHIKGICSNHPKILQCILNCLFLLRRTLWLPGIVGLWFVVVLSFDYPILTLHLCDIKMADIYAMIFQHILFYLFIRRLTTLVLQHFIHVYINIDMYWTSSQN